jgi:hypothetical protein
METTKVIFRIDPRNREVIALFPEEVGTNDFYTCSAYVHVGQHFTCYPDLVIQHTKPAVPEQYEDLHQELTQRGYELKVIKRYQHTHLLKRFETLQSYILPDNL